METFSEMQRRKNAVPERLTNLRGIEPLDVLVIEELLTVLQRVRQLVELCREQPLLVSHAYDRIEREIDDATERFGTKKVALPVGVELTPKVAAIINAAVEAGTTAPRPVTVDTETDHAQAIRQQLQELAGAKPQAPVGDVLAFPHAIDGPAFTVEPEPQ